MQQSTSSSTGYPTLLSGVIRFNVGGTVIEMSREMLELYPKSLLRELAQKCPEGAEAFIDRDAYGLKTIVDYLHCGPRVIYAECTSLANADFLEKEAEYYGIDDLAIKCSSLYEFKPRCEVNWRPDVVDSLQEWSALKSHMLSMLGIVEKLVGYSCLLIRWSNGIQTHLPKSAVRVVIEDM